MERNLKFCYIKSVNWLVSEVRCNNGQVGRWADAPFYMFIERRLCLDTNFEEAGLV